MNIILSCTYPANVWLKLILALLYTQSFKIFKQVGSSIVKLPSSRMAHKKVYESVSPSKLNCNKRHINCRCVGLWGLQLKKNTACYRKFVLTFRVRKILHGWGMRCIRCIRDYEVYWMRQRNISRSVIWSSCQELACPWKGQGFWWKGGWKDGS